MDLRHLRLSECCKNFKAAIFSWDTNLSIKNIINVNLFTMTVLSELYPFMPLCKRLILCRGKSRIKQFN